MPALQNNWARDKMNKQIVLNFWVKLLLLLSLMAVSCREDNPRPLATEAYSALNQLR